MKRTLYALVPWMVLAAAASGQVRSADVAYAYSYNIPTRAFRLGDECFVSIDSAAMWGWQWDVRGDQATVRAEGKSLTVPLRSIAGRPSLAVRKAIDQLGGESEWLSGSDTLEVWSNLSKVTLRNGRLQVGSPLAMKVTVTPQPLLRQVAIDLEGVRLTRSTQFDLDNNVRATQFRPNTVRIVVQTDDADEVSQFTNPQTRSFDFVLGEGPRRIEKQPEIRIVDPPVQQPDTIPPIRLPVETTTLDLFVDAEGQSNALLMVRVPKVNGVTFTKPDPAVLEVKLPGVFKELPTDFHLETDSVVGATTRIYDGGTILTLNLSRPMGANVSSDASGVQIQLVKPNVGNGRLAGKIVVVDPGHGGHDSGAKSGGVREKDLNLAIGKLLSQELASQGATVVVTRKTDVFLSLGSRADIANRNRADFFISVHINSTASAKMSGTITFHHKGRETSRVLAECIQKQIAKVNNLPDIGVWSDGRIYNSGFAVLRQTSMPGVLCELGFINHSRDRNRMVTDDFQSSVAKAIVRGLKDYLGDE